MKSKILAWIAIIWGGLVLLRGLSIILSGHGGGGTYGAGQIAALLFAGLLLFIGIRTLVKN